ncbi:right-handed parallel beta-helix repeat-containing protein [Pengzhenrongella sicca]|uniref:Right-handed parallel beta-helix repeat-containing protein n=2 Tax=Pengzhenrongella sicca TaxID=2819238 RepID=A0A8A4ZPQ0_9MICO|nr:right-handed parallel beta-helix repeat-containing protein [Pengzhenrongella sicca]
MTAGAPLAPTNGTTDDATDNPPDDDDDDDDDGDDDDGDLASLDAPSAIPDWMSAPTPTTAPCPAPTVRVGDAAELQAALDGAGPGTVIGLAAGVYTGNFVATASGSPERPARLCGPADAVIDGGNQEKGYALHLDGAQFWVLQGFTVRNAQKGVMADGTTGSVLSGLTVYGIGDEAIHLRGGSTDTLVEGNTISDTGRRKPKFGEGVYIGTAHSNWCDVSDCEPDLSDHNRVIGNLVYATTSEAIDVKEGTTGGLVQGNQFDGSGLVEADSWVDVKGNDWAITGNVGRATVLDGFQTHDVSDGWGTGNVFAENTGSLGDDPDGFLVALRPANENVVQCSNRLLGGVGGLSNESCG